MHLNISQAASLLGTSEAMLERWVHQGAIPAVEQGNGIFFERKDLENWAIRRRIQLRNIDDVPLNQKPQTASILDAMTAGGFYYDLEGATSESLLTNVVAELKLPNIENALLLERVLERENLSSTGIGNGIAIPHPRQPMEALSKSLVVTCFPRHPVSFNAVDGKDVTVVFLVLSVDTRTHLKLLSQLSYILHQPGNTDFLQSAPSAEHILARVREHSQHLAR
ncbi:MAG: PTS sugar transporter subunit IIA [Deltaproteobacteria bacterium]|nr:PTS sugar transporter subunit IIA [Deltaproteobacteria bacterium]